MFIISVSLLSLVFCEQILSLFDVSHQQRGNPEIDYRLMSFRSVMAYLITVGGCWIFHNIITKSDVYNHEIMNKLKSNALQINSQNEKLIGQQSRLNVLNQSLEKLVEKKNYNIKIQNEKLSNYAFLNAHEVRGPLARLLGLVQLSKIDPKVDYPLLFEKIDHETKEIDHIIRGISEELNQGHFHEESDDIPSSDKNED